MKGETNSPKLKESPAELIFLEKIVLMSQLM